MGLTMMVVLRATNPIFFQLTLIDNANLEVVVVDVRKESPKASIKYLAGAMTAPPTTNSDVTCTMPPNATDFEFSIKLSMTLGPLQCTCGTAKTQQLTASDAGKHLWKNLAKVRLSGEGAYTLLTYVPVEVPSVETYVNKWEIPLPGKKEMTTGDMLEAAFKVKTDKHPYFFTLSSSGPDDHWLCYVKTESELVKVYQAPCWNPDYDWYTDMFSFTTTRNIPPSAIGSIFRAQIKYTGSRYKVYIDSEFSTEVESKVWLTPATRMIYSTGHLELLWIKFL